MTFAVQFGLYQRLLREPLRTRDVERVKTALKRWAKVAIVWQVLVLGACGAYLVAFNPGDRTSITWIAPAVGALFGTAIPLQFVVMALLRSMRA